MEEEEEYRSVIIDVGSYESHGGFSGDDAPRAVVPTISGKPKYKSDFSDIFMSGSRNYIGDIAKINAYLEIENVISDGEIKNWEKFEKLLHHTFYNELRIAPEEYSCFMTDPLFSSNTQKEKKIMMLFETFSVPSFFMTEPPALSHMASGRNTALVIDIGETTIQTTAIIDGFTMKPATKRFNFGGRDITNYLIELLTQRNVRLSNSHEFYIADGIKKNSSFVSADYEKDVATTETSNTLEKSYELPDSTVITLGKERFDCQEALFNPLLVSKESKGVHEIVNDAIQSIDLGCRKDFYGNILISGGSSMVEGFSDRLENEMKKLLPKAAKVKIVAPPERKYMTWIGGSILSSLTSYQKAVITSEAYDEYGPSIIHKKKK